MMKRPHVSRPVRVGIIPFGEDTNPYQELTRRAMIKAGLEVHAFPKSNFLPLWRAARSGVDALHLDWPHSFYRGRNAVFSKVKQAMFRWQLPRLGGTKVAWTVHEPETHDTHGNGDEPMQLLVERSDALISLSHSGVPIIRSRWKCAKKKPITVIPHGHYCDWYNVGRRREEARAALRLPPHGRLTVFVGRLLPYKGIENLPEGFSRVRGRNDYLLIAGAPLNAEYAQTIRNMVAGDEHVLLRCGWLTKNELENVLCAADVSVFPFRKIFNSGSVMLALSFGLPVVAPAKGAIPEVVPEEAWFNAGEAGVEELAQALRAAFRAGDLARRGSNARGYVQKYHSWEIVGNDLRKLYVTLCSRG